MNHLSDIKNIRKKVSHLRGFSFHKHPLIVILALFFLLESFSSFVFYWQMIELTPFSYAVIALLADLMVPVLAVTMAYFYQSRLLAVLSICAMSVVLFIKIANNIIFGQMYSIICYGTCKVLLGHADHHSLSILFGRFYYIWLFFCVGLFLYLIVSASIISAKSVSVRIHPGELNRIRVCLLLVLLAAVGANAKYSIECYDVYGKYHFKSEYVARPALSFAIDYLQEHKQERVRGKRPKQIGYFPTELSQKTLDYLQEWGVLEPEQKNFPVMEKPFTKIILIALESMDLANLHCYNPKIPADVTPFMDQLSKDYLSFSNYFTASQPTSWGLNSMILSRIEYEADLTLENHSVYDLLQEQGYQGYYLSPMNGMFANNRKTYEEQFRPRHILFLEELNEMFGITGGKTWGITDNNMYYCANQILQKMPENSKYFMMISTIDTHPPYTESGPLENQTGQDTPFLKSLRCSDRNLQDFLEPLMKSEHFDERMLIIVTADHSATHGENYHRREDLSPDRIPLIFITRDNWLEKAYPFDREKLCSQIDLPVTLVNLLGIKAPQTFMGRNIITKKSFAYTKSPQYLSLHLPGGRNIGWTFAQQTDSATAEEKAVYDFYDLYYGIEELPENSENYNLF